MSSQAANQWSSCQTVTAVTNLMANSAPGILLGLSPGLSGCSPVGVIGALMFSVGVDGVVATNIDSFLATSLTAYTTGHQVMVYYDNTTSTCQGISIAISGYSGQCP